MGKSVNKVIILGRIGKDPTLRKVGNSTVAQFSVATESSFKDKSGEWQKNTDWHECIAWGKLADVVQQYVSKGDQIYVEGRLQTRSWDDKETGQKRYKTEVVVGELCLLSERKEEKQNSPATATEEDIQDSDIPF